jgi:hypothetical protein
LAGTKHYHIISAELEVLCEIMVNIFCSEKILRKFSRKCLFNVLHNQKIGDTMNAWLSTCNTKKSRIFDGGLNILSRSLISVQLLVKINSHLPFDQINYSRVSRTSCRNGKRANPTYRLVTKTRNSGISISFLVLQKQNKLGAPHPHYFEAGSVEQ